MTARTGQSKAPRSVGEAVVDMVTPAGDTDAFARGLVYLLERPGSNTAACRTRTERVFAKPVVSAQYVALYEDILRGTADSAPNPYKHRNRASPKLSGPVRTPSWRRTRHRPAAAGPFLANGVRAACLFLHHRQRLRGFFRGIPAARPAWSSHRRTVPATAAMLPMGTSNPLHAQTFHPENRKDARKFLGLNQERPIILFGHASNSWLKGSDILASALNIMGPKRPFDVITFGNSSHESSKFSDKHFGLINDDEILRKLYCASNVFVTPARQEAFGRANTEAMACGTPVVAFSGSGPDDIIIHKKTGYLAQYLNAHDLAAGIRDMIESNEAISNNCVNQVRKKFSARRVAQGYIDLYNEKIISSRI